MNVIVTSIDYILNWGRANSLWPLTFATSCCGIEMMQTVASNNDISRFGSEIFRGSPRQADLLICAGTITHKMAPALLRLYEQMPEPKYVIAMGACTCGGGMFAETSYSVVKGIDKIIPAVKVEKVVDTTGAGDTFNGVLAACLAEDDGVERACQKANIAAAIKVARKYILDSIPTREEIEKYEKEQKNG